MFDQDIIETGKALKRLLAHSFEPIEWTYENLTENEQELVTPEQFALITKWAKNLS